MGALTETFAFDHLVAVLAVAADKDVAGIETHSEGTNLSADTVTAYTTWLRQAVGVGRDGHF